LGVCGGKIHSEEEFLLLPSLVQRSQLSALMLMKMASGAYDVRHLRGVSP
jgi:glutamate carboxypeptidase